MKHPSYTTVKVKLEMELLDEEGVNMEAVTRAETIARINEYLLKLSQSPEGDVRLNSFEILE